MSTQQPHESLGTEREKSFLERFFWPLFAMGLIAAVTALVMLFIFSIDSYKKMVDELNDHYVEEISVQPGGKYSRDVIVIIGRSRYDCSEHDGYLSCKDEPQPTPEN